MNLSENQNDFSAEKKPIPTIFAVEVEVGVVVVVVVGVGVWVEVVVVVGMKRDWENFYRASDFDVGEVVSPRFLGISQKDIENIIRLTNERAALCANAILKEELAKAPEMRGFINQFETWLWDESRDKRDTHTARLVDIQEINK